MDDLAAELDSFRIQYPIDDDAYNYIVNSPVEVQQEVLRDFKPKQEGEEDYSALVIGFTKRRRQQVKDRQMRGGHAPVAGGHFDGGRNDHFAAVSEEDLEAFRARYPVDEEAFRFLNSCPSHVQHTVLQTFKPPREGEEDYSALLITFAKRCRQNQAPQATPRPEFRGYTEHTVTVPARAPPRGGVNYEAFRARYPFDDAAHNYLQKAPPEIRIHVLQNFKPKQEGEADYSALIISYCKKMREHSQQAMPVQPVHMQPMMQPVQQIPMQMQHYGEHYPIPAPQRAPWNQPAQPPPVAPRGSLMGASESNANIYALEGFRQRYPMDDRAFDFLKCASAFVQQEVLERFSPQKQDSDYSALIISFAKKCREREPAMNAAKRPRMF